MRPHDLIDVKLSNKIARLKEIDVNFDIQLTTWFHPDSAEESSFLEAWIL